jgi:dCTP diphosphatase
MMTDRALNVILKFREERDWKQFHTPKNLSMSIAIEAAELMEIFQWSGKVPAEAISAKDHERVREEIADVAIYLMLLAHDLDIDLERAVVDKVARNAEKYPADQFRGVYRTDE